MNDEVNICGDYSVWRSSNNSPCKLSFGWKDWGYLLSVAIVNEYKSCFDNSNDTQSC